MLEGRGYRITEYEWGGRDGDRLKGRCLVTASLETNPGHSAEAVRGHVEYVTEIRLRERDNYQYADVYSASRRGDDLPLMGIFAHDQSEQSRISDAITASEPSKDRRR